MNVLLFGIILIEFCSARSCEREKGRIQELFRKNGEFIIEQNKLKAEKRELIAQKNELTKEIEKLNKKLTCALKVRNYKKIF